VTIPAPAPASTAVDHGAASASTGTSSSAAPAQAPSEAHGQPVTAPVGLTVTVRPGDTLWDIAAEHLPPGATTTDVAAAWPDWYRENLAVVGGDPDLIRPGQQLDRPTADGSATPAGAGS
jgi:nucleoid-associated protein YgaU